jgi:nucleotide-binding universal stress UspA family protein
MKITHVLVPLDHSELSEAALEYAVELIQPQGKVTLLWVLSTEMVETEVHIKPQPFFDGLRQEPVTTPAWEVAEQYLERIANKIRTPSCTVDIRIAEGEPALRILDVAKTLDVDAIVMSTHGRSGVSRWVFGSVAQKVVSAAICPVFLVPQRSLEHQPTE